MAQVPSITFFGDPEYLSAEESAKLSEIKTRLETSDESSNYASDITFLLVLAERKERAFANFVADVRIGRID